MRATTCACVSPCVCAWVFSTHPSPRSLQKTKTTAVKGIMPRGNCGEKLPIMPPQTHMYAPCHDVLPDTPSQLLMPRAQPAQVDILHKHTHQKYTHRVQEQVQRQVCVCVVDFSHAGICSSFQYSNTLRCVRFLTFSHPVEKQTQHTCWLREDRWRRTTVLLLYSFSSQDLLLLENDPYCWRNNTKAVKIHHHPGPNKHIPCDYTVIIPYITGEGSACEHGGIH